MMKNPLIATLAIGAAIAAGAAHADTKQPVALWLCSDYVGLDESFRPAVLGFAEGVNRKGKPEDALLDVQGIVKVQPEVLTYCKENPKVALRDALIQSWKKTAK